MTRKPFNIMVGATGIEPVTPTMSTKGRPRQPLENMETAETVEASAAPCSVNVPPKWDCEPKGHYALSPVKVGQKIFREWCAEFGAVVDVLMAADLIKRIERAIIAERAEGVRKFTYEEITDLLSALDEAQAELCTGPGFPEATAQWARWQKLKERLETSLTLRKATP